MQYEWAKCLKISLDGKMDPPATDASTLYNFPRNCTLFSYSVLGICQFCLCILLNTKYQIWFNWKLNIVISFPGSKKAILKGMYLSVKQMQQNAYFNYFSLLSTNSMSRSTRESWSGHCTLWQNQRRWYLFLHQQWLVCRCDSDSATLFSGSGIIFYNL